MKIEHHLTGSWRLLWESRVSFDPFFRLELDDGMLYLDGPWSWAYSRISLNRWAAGSAIASFVFLIGLLRKRRPLIACGACMKCGYDLTGNISGVCPECGLMVPGEDRLKFELATPLKLGRTGDSHEIDCQQF